MKRRISRRFQPTMTPGLDQLESRQLLSSGFQVVSSPTVTGSDFSAVSAVSPTDIWAVGSDSTGPLIENFNGTSWSQVAAPAVNGGALNGVSALSSNDVWAVGESTSGPLVEFFNGTSWKVQTTPTISGGGGSLNAVTAISPTDVWAVGRQRLRTTSSRTSTARAGASSRPRHQPLQGALTGISAVSSTDIFAVGSVPKGDQLLQFNGTTWSVLTSQSAGSDATRPSTRSPPPTSGSWATPASGISTGRPGPSSPSERRMSSSSHLGLLVQQYLRRRQRLLRPNGLKPASVRSRQWNGTSWSAVTSANPGNNQTPHRSDDPQQRARRGGRQRINLDLDHHHRKRTHRVGDVHRVPAGHPDRHDHRPHLHARLAVIRHARDVHGHDHPREHRLGRADGHRRLLQRLDPAGGGTVSNDVATFTTTALPVGTSSITATYGGDSNYAASTSPAVTVTITQSTTTTAVSFSPASPVLGQDVTLTATITPASTGPASPTGTVEFFDGSTLLGSGTVSSDAATLTTTALSLGTNSITATYEGDSNYDGSTSPAVTVTVVQSATPPSASFQLVTSPTVTGVDLSAVSSVSPTDIWAVGSQSTSNGDVAPLTENFNGTSWSVVAAPTPAGASVAEFSSVSAVASNNVWAVGFSLSVNNSGVSVSTPLVEHFNGTSWSIQTTPATAGKLNAVTAVSATDVWAVGGTGSADLIENFNGTTWSVVQAPSPGTSDPSLGGISAISSTDIFAVGGVGKGNFPQVLQFNGTTWSSLANLPTGIADAAIDAISATDVWTVGDGGIWNFNGTSWTEVASGELATCSPSRAPRPTTSSPSAKPYRPWMRRSSSSGTARAGASSPAQARASSPE